MQTSVDIDDQLLLYAKFGRVNRFFAHRLQLDSLMWRAEKWRKVDNK